MEPITEQRKFARVNFLQGVEAIVDEQSYRTHCLDISLQGILLARPDNADSWKKGQNIHTNLILSPEHNIEMNAKIIHLDNEIVGLVCQEMDIDSLTTLRRLLEFNLANPEEINRELAELIQPT